jgi:hypothetical protein
VPHQALTGVERPRREDEVGHVDLGTVTFRNLQIVQVCEEKRQGCETLSPVDNELLSILLADDDRP